MSAELAGPPRQESGQPQEHASTNPTVRAIDRAVVELQAARGFMDRDIAGIRTDIAGLDTKLDKVLEKIADLRSSLEGRLTAAETNILHLPSKTWIFSVTGALLAAIGMLVAVVYKLATGH